MLCLPALNAVKPLDGDMVEAVSDYDTRPNYLVGHRIAATALADQIPGLRSAIRVKLQALSRACGTGVPLETTLYLPVKRFLENLGFTVKGEVGGCDVVALSADQPPIVVIGELKLSFNL